MKIEIANTLWSSGKNVFVSAQRPASYFGSMLTAWVSGEKSRKYKTVVYDIGDSIAVLIPERLARDHNLSVGDNFVGALTFRSFRSTKNLPADLEIALGKRRQAFFQLSQAEQRQALLLLAESTNPEVRSSRIFAIAMVCESVRATEPDDA